MRRFYMYLIVAIPSLAFAQTVAPPSAANTDPSSLLGQMLGALQGRNWIIAVGAGLCLSTFLLRSWGSAWWPWLRTDRGGAALVLTVSVLGAAGTAIVGGHFTAQSVLDGVIVATNAAGGYALLRKIFLPNDPEPIELSHAPPPPKGFASMRTLLAVLGLSLVLTLTGCAWLKGSSASGTVSGNGADVTVTIPDGTTIGVTISGSQACVQDGSGFVSIPYFGLECNAACGALVQGGIGVQLTCRVKGTTGPTFPFTLGLPLLEQSKASALVARQR